MAVSGSNGIDGSKISIQRSDFGGFNDAPTILSCDIMPKAGMDYWSGSNAGQVAGAEPSRLLGMPGSIAPNMNYHTHRGGGSTEYWVQVNLVRYHLVQVLSI